MDKKLLMSVGKWLVMGLLTVSNFTFYIVNKSSLNLILAVVIIVYSFYEFFRSISGKKLNMGVKLYLFTFYLLAVLSLFLGVRSFLMDNFKFVLTSIILTGGDTALILYILHKFTVKKQ